ncbi:MAG: hypothetical protein ACM3SX_14180 [Deltaproteobacteria bacterium]
MLALTDRVTKHLWKAGIALVVAAIPASLTAQAKAIVPPRSAEELAARFRRAQEKHDAEAIQRLFYWGASDSGTRTAVSAMISQDVSHAARRVFVAPLGANEQTEYTKGGVVYRMTLPPTAKLTIDFIPRDAHGGHYNSEQTTYFIGVRDGAYWLVTAEPARAPRDSR